MIKYLGSKRVLLPTIVRVVQALGAPRSALDLFSGTARVGHGLKRAGLRVVANDHLAYAATLARCYVQADRERVARDAERLIAELAALPGEDGYFTETFCRQSRFFRPENGARVDAIRAAIARKSLPPELEAVLLVALMEAADRVDSTTGLQMAYLKAWAPRARNSLDLRLPELLPASPFGPGRALQRDALDAAAEEEVDVAYLDPPYNQHRYAGNYHIWETLVRWDAPEAYGTARKRVDTREHHSPFNRRREAAGALRAVLGALRARHVVLSFSNEGFLTRAEVEAMLAAWGEVRVLTVPYRRYVGARIGIHNPAGERVGTVSHLDNVEYLFVASRAPEALFGLDALGATPADPPGAALPDAP